MDGQRRAMIARAAAGVVVIVLAAAGLAGIALALGLGDREPLDVQVARIATEAKEAAEPDRDPFAYTDARAPQLEERAELGSSHVIYELSPGGVVASAKRTDEWREEIARAAEAHGVEPATLEAMVFLESAGRPDVMAGSTPEAASGLAQILPATATELLGMQVDLPESIALTKRIAHTKTPEEAERLREQRAEIDERFDPAAALEGAATYLEIAEDRFGSAELAVVSYHMGIGNLESVLRAYAGASDEQPIAGLVAAEDLTYGEVFFESSPQEHREAYELLTGFGDDSSQYLWKIRAAEEIMSRWRDDPAALEATAELATAKATLEEVFHPEDETEVFDDPGELEDAIAGGEVVQLPLDPKLGWVPAKQMGELAGELDQSPGLYQALRPEALAALSYLAGIVRNASDEERPLKVTSTVRDLEYQGLLIDSNPEATSEYSLHTTGWSFDIKREYASDRQAQAFQYALDRLSSFALIDYAVEPGAIHITVSELGGALVRD